MKNKSQEETIKLEYFNLKANNTSIKQEILAGITTFATMSYILVVNPQILGAAGMDKNGVFVATVLGTVIATLIMGLYAKLPFAVAPGLGINSFFTYNIVLNMHYSWKVGLLATYMSSIIFLLILKLNIYEKIVDSISENIKYSIVSGLGIAIALLGFKSSNIISLNSEGQYSLGQVFSIQALLCIIGLIIILIFMKRNVAGAILIGIIVTYILGIILQLKGIYIVDPSKKMYSLIPEFDKHRDLISGFKQVAFQFPSLMEITVNLKSIIDFIVIIFMMFFTHFFDAMGTLFGLFSMDMNMEEKEHKEKRKKAMYVEAVGELTGVCLGTTTVTTYAENSIGLVSGGRTGLTAVVIASCFTFSLFLSPIFTAIPSFAIAPALIIAGLTLTKNILKIDFKDLTEAIPAFMLFVLIGLTFDIVNSTLLGIAIYIIGKLVTGKKKEINKFSYVLVIISIIYLIFL